MLLHVVLIIILQKVSFDTGKMFLYFISKVATGLKLFYSNFAMSSILLSKDQHLFNSKALADQPLRH